MFRSSKDHLQFVRSALPAAIHGDGRAAWYIAQAVSQCALTVKEYKGSSDPEAQLQQALDRMSGAPQWRRDLLSQRTRRCVGLAQSDPFEALPPRADGYPSAYWYDSAVQDGEPLALQRKASIEINEIMGAHNMTDAEKTNQLTNASADLRTAVESGDPDVLFQAGILLMDGRLTSTPETGIAISLAACELGSSNCTSDNPESPLYNCQFSGQCTAGSDYVTVIQHDLGPQDYARVYSQAQQIEQLARAGDWVAISAKLTFDKLN
jgi:hypothetical protein